MRIMTFGTFDCLHPGHLNYLKQAQSFGDELIVIVARDCNVLRIKGRLPVEDEQTRLANLRLLFKKSKTVLGGKEDKWLVLRKYRPDFIALGYDQAVDLSRLKIELEKCCPFCKIKRLESYYPNKYKSSLRRIN